jgi:hypothetical protein
MQDGNGKRLFYGVGAKMIEGNLCDTAGVLVQDAVVSVRQMHKPKQSIVLVFY